MSTMLFIDSERSILRSLDMNEHQRKSSMFLSDPPDSFTPENLLADELKKLSYDDRLEIEEEVHGVGCRATTETPALVELSLAVFDDQVNRRKENDPSCAHLLRNVVRCWPSPEANGSSASKCYLNDPSVRLRFLRCELFNVEKAVQRFIDFLDFMSELFGDYVTVRPVCLSDFSKEEEMHLAQSRYQFLPFRDRSGRRVLAGVGNCNFHMDRVLRHKIFMYLSWVASEDVETQIKGSVILCWAFDEKDDSTWENKISAGLSKKLKVFHQKQSKALPVRVASWQHYYLDTPYFRFLASLFAFSFVRTSPHRSVFKVHFGSEVELKYKLSSYGVPVELLPMSSTGTIKFDNHRDWLSVIRTKAIVDPKYRDEVVECPRFNDVVYRKGPATKLNTGNAYYRDLIADYSLEHFTADRNKKYEITKFVIKKVEERGGRFLEWKNMWVVHRDQEKIRKKIASAFKQYNRSRKKGESDQLLQAIAIATSIGDNGPDCSSPEKVSSEKVASEKVASCDIRAEDDDSTAGRTRTVTDSVEYAFLQNPAKRRRIDAECNPDLFCSFDDGGCFGKCFFPTEQGL